MANQKRKDGRQTRTETVRTERTVRGPLGVMRKKMNVDPETLRKLSEAGVVPRIVNDEDNGVRIRAFIEQGYQFVLADGDLMIGDDQKVPDSDTRIRWAVGTNKDGSPKYAYLMAIRKDWHEEDQEEKEEVNAKVDAAIRGGSPRGVKNHGLSPDKGSGYVPKGGISYEPKKTPKRYTP